MFSGEGYLWKQRQPWQVIRRPWVEIYIRIVRQRMSLIFEQGKTDVMGLQE